MDSILYTTWLATQAYSGLSYFWYVSFPIAVIALIAIVWLALHPPVSNGARVAFWASLLSPIFLLLYGGILRADRFSSFGTTVSGSLFFVLVLGVIFAFVAAIAIAQTQRLAAIAIVMLGIWLTLWSLFVSAMSVTGDWL